MSCDVELTAAEATIAIGAAAMDAEVYAAAADISIASALGEIDIAVPETSVAFGGAQLAGSFDVVKVTSITYSAIHGRTDFWCLTNRNAVVQFKMTNPTYGTITSEWSTPVGRDHTTFVFNTTGDEIWSVYVQADAVEGDDLGWTYIADIYIPPRGDPPDEGDLPDVEG